MKTLARKKHKVGYTDDFFETFYWDKRVGLYKIDVTIWLYALLYLAVFIWQIVTDNQTRIYPIIMIALSMIIIAILQFAFRKTYDMDGFFKKNIRVWLIPAVNLLIVLGAVFLSPYKSRDDYLLILTNTFETAMWENLTFGIIATNLLTFLIGFFVKKKQWRKLIYGIIVIAASIGFGVAHLVVQQGNWNNIGFLMGLGLVFVGTAFGGIPSLGVSIHVLNNLVLAG